MSWRWGSAFEHVRTWAEIEDKRRGRRWCRHPAPGGPCPRRCTHLGLANGIALMSGCEWHVRLWCAQGPLNKREPGQG